MRVFNFSAGPSTLPEEVLLEAQAEILDYGSTGTSVMEMSHRSKAFLEITEQVKERLRKLVNIPEEYEILFLQGGASSQFSMVPMNLMINKKADYIDTGVWSVKAMKEARRYGDIKVLASSKEDSYSYIPDLTNLDIRDDADYVHITENNTIYGTEYKILPDTKGKILVSDASSNALSREMDITKYGIYYAGAQKNLGIAGVTLVIVRKDLIREDLAFDYPSMFKYSNHAGPSSYNTPPTYAIYMMGLLLKWLDSIGGLKEIERINDEKSSLLYDYLDNSKLFKTYAQPEFRSRMNVTFTTKSDDLDKLFVEQAAKNGLVNLKGHKSLGGLRASIYNAMPIEGVKKLVNFMDEFERNNG